MCHEVLQRWSFSEIRSPRLGAHQCLTAAAGLGAHGTVATAGRPGPAPCFLSHRLADASSVVLTSPLHTSSSRKRQNLSAVGR